MQITLTYSGPKNDDGAFYGYSHDAEVRDEDEAICVGREFGRLVQKLSSGINEGMRVLGAVEDGE